MWRSIFFSIFPLYIPLRSLKFYRNSFSIKCDKVYSQTQFFYRRKFEHQLFIPREVYTATTWPASCLVFLYAVIAGKDGQLALTQSTVTICSSREASGDERSEFQTVVLRRVFKCLLWDRWVTVILQTWYVPDSHWFNVVRVIDTNNLGCRSNRRDQQVNGG